MKTFSITETHHFFYKRYIDDIILFWRGSQSIFDLFLMEMSLNLYGLKFTAEVSYSTVNYLDLTITKNNNKLETKTFFKATDRNGFVPTQLPPSTLDRGSPQRTVQEIKAQLY